jgi:hypothetical protein
VLRAASGITETGIAETGIAETGIAETGRGLAIVDSLTRGAWGCQPAIGQVGKCVWAEIPVRDSQRCDRVIAMRSAAS